MCVLSMVYDHYKPRFPHEPWQVPEIPMPGRPPSLPRTSPTENELRRLIREFREAVEAAKAVDRLTGQPDCEDAEKAKLEERVAALERELEALKAPKGATAQGQPG